MSNEFWKKRRDARLGPEPKTKKETKDELTVWYEKQALKAPPKCENCGAPLGSTGAFHPRAHICHIFPKSDFKSIATNDWNAWFGCLKCHSEYDTWFGQGKWIMIQSMRIWLFLPDRVSMFIDSIVQEEQRRIPEIFKP